MESKMVRGVVDNLLAIENTMVGLQCFAGDGGWPGSEGMALWYSA